jgi:hypothetical protein
MGWREATNTANAISPDWRLPTKEELLAQLRINAQGFRSAMYWTSTPYGETEAYAIDVQTMSELPVDRRNSLRVRFCKSGNISSVQTPPVQPTPAPTTRTTQRGQRRQAGNSSYIASWISSVGKTNTSIIQYITRNSLAKMYRNYVRWLNTTHPTSNPVSQLTFRQWIGSNYPEAERVIGR